MADDGKRLNGEGLQQVWESMQYYVQETVQGGGTVKSVTAGEGLLGGTITESGIIALKPASSNELGGVKVSYDDETETLYINTNTDNKVSKAVNFYDYDGTIVYSYDKNEFLALSTLPANPTHEGLSGQGWNWSLADAQTYMSRHDFIDIGQNYITSDGKTRIYVDMDKNSLFATLSIYCEDANTQVEFNWGDGSSIDSMISSMTGYLSIDHLYDDSGEYIITIDVKNNHNIYIPGAALDVSGENWDSQRRRSYLLSSSGFSTGFPLDKVKKIEIGSHVTKIQSCGLERLYGLETITIPNSVIDIGADAFAYDNSLKAIIIPKNLADHELKAEMFINTNSLEVISIPNGITHIDDNFLNGVAKLKRLVFPDTFNEFFNPTCIYGLIDIEELSLPITTSSISLWNSMWSGYYEYYSKLKKINLKDLNVEEIGDYLFGYCLNLEEIIFPQNCIEIGEYVCAGCKGVKTINMPNTITTIGTYAFNGCISLANINLSTNLTSIPIGCFQNCIKLKTLNIPSSVITIDQNAFANCSSLEVLDIPNSVQSIGIGALQKCENLIKVKMSKDISAIPAHCFEYTPNLKLIDCLEYNYIPDLADVNAFTQAFTTDYHIVVPDDLYAEWIAATNWNDSSIVSHIISKTDYEIDASHVPLFEHDDNTPEPFPISI